jgi:hypothetical protein
LRLELLRVPRSVTLAEMASDRALPIDLEALAVVNGVSADETLEVGTTIKWVVGEPPPGL